MKREGQPMESLRTKVRASAPPVANLHEAEKIHLQNDYYIYLTKIAESIVFIDTTGTLKNYDVELFDRALEDFRLRHDVKAPYIKIRDLGHVTGRLPFHLMKAQIGSFLANQNVMCGVVILHQPNWLRAFIRHAQRLYKTRFQVQVGEDLPEGIRLARQMLETVRQGEVPRRPMHLADVLFHDDWVYTNRRTGCTYRIGLIPDKLYFVSVSGPVTCEDDILQGGRVLERVLVENHLTAIPYIIVDYSGLTAIRSLRLRQRWAREADRINRLTCNTRAVHVAVNPDRLTRLAIQVFSPFLQQKVLMVGSVEEAFERINELSGAPEALDRRRTLAVSAADLEELSDALGMLLWHAGEEIAEPRVSADNPLAHLVETIGLVRSDLNDLLERERRTQAQLVQAQKMESVGRLAGGVAHDFNNMLSVIKGNVELVLEQLEPDFFLREELEEIRQAAQNSANLTRQLLAFARRQTVTPQVLDLNATVAGTLTMIRRLIGEEHRLSWEPGENLGPVFIDPSQMDQVLANLCVNARDALDGPGTITIGTRARHLEVASEELEAGDYLVLWVADDGCGMTPETMASLFEPFFTTKETGKGTGLGLSMIYGIARQNDGGVRVHSTLGAGSVFEVWLPRYAGERKVEAVAAAPVAPTEAGGAETVLLVEDEESILKLARRVLTRQGYRVLAASTPGEALALAQTHTGPLDLLITDVVMPEMNGRELADAVRASFPGIRRLFMSGYTREIIGHQGVLEDGVHFLHKPFSSSELAAKVREALAPSSDPGRHTPEKMPIKIS